jgi:hypothetical protein
MMNITINKDNKDIYEFLKVYYNAQVKESLFHIKRYMNNISAIGEHSELTPEIDKWFTKLSDADGKLKMLETYFDENL